jgi:trehalose 6-phosphate synthase
MRIGLRVGVSLSVVLILVACLFAFFEVKAQELRTRENLERQAMILADTVAEAVGGPLERKSRAGIQHVLERVGAGLVGLAIYEPDGTLYAVTPTLAGRLPSRPSAVNAAAVRKTGSGSYIQLENTSVYVYARPLRNEDSIVGTLALFEDATPVEVQTAKLWRESLKRLLVEMLLIPFFAFIVVRWSVQGPIARTAQWMTDLRKGKSNSRPGLSDEELFKPLTQEVKHFAQSLEAARAAAAMEARLRIAAQTIWTSERLRAHVRNKLQGQPLFVVSNREPYEHVRQGKGSEIRIPASGLVTALEPILRACDGTWIAHGAGNADREAVDSHDRLRVPPEEPAYTLRRVWLTPEEEKGYYYGFANEGLWPLCHIAHTRPLFRADDWGCYQAVNQKFAEAVLDEIKGTDRPAVLVQDYHFALLPSLIKEKRPDARVAIFWHIPWPNPQAFGICPWQRDLLDGLLGADLIGFHIQSHCNYFLETVDGALESRVDWERFSVSRRDHLTQVRTFPISVAIPEKPSGTKPTTSVYLQRATLFRNLGVHATYMGIGVDRVDYTKGIIERFAGIERFLEKYPAYQKQFTFVQIGAPSRTNIKSYSDLLAQVGAEAARINARFQTNDWKPIVLLQKHHSHKEIESYYRAADLCLVTSLHDGMNLVAKEFIAARDDEEGALILSHFTGASRALHDALLVNPYDKNELAEAIHLALEMDPEEKKARMQRMRHFVEENNIFRWAGDLITELAGIRLERTEPIRSG